VRCRRSPGWPTEGTAPISVRRAASRTVGPPSRHRSGPDRRRTRDRRGTHPGGDRSPRGERGPSGPSSERRPPRRRSCTSWRRGERRRSSLRWCGRRSGPRLCARAGVPCERPGERGQGRRRHHGVCRHPSVTLVAPNPGHCHEPGDLVPPDVVAGFLSGDDMSVWIPSLRSAPTGGPSQKRARRIRTASPLPEPTGAGGVPRRRCAGQWSVRQMGLAELRAPGSLARSRMPAVSLEVTRGSSFADVRLSTLRPDSAPTPSVLATGEISPASLPVSAAGGPTRRTACSFSPAVSLRRCRSATTDLLRARRRSRCPGLCCHGSSSTHGESPQGNEEESERI